MVGVGGVVPSGRGVRPWRVSAVSPPSGRGVRPWRVSAVSLPSGRGVAVSDAVAAAVSRCGACHICGFSGGGANPTA